MGAFFYVINVQPVPKMKITAVNISVPVSYTNNWIWVKWYDTARLIFTAVLFSFSIQSVR